MVHRWPNGAEWVIQVHHLSRLYVPEHKPITAGALLADGGGVRVSRREYSHFVFRVRDGSDEVLLGPWILFWQMYRDRGITLER
ncbi:MAG: hypothetical protein AMXMBFR7_44690 [Planctomycetota bacterium]